MKILSYLSLLFLGMMLVGCGQTPTNTPTPSPFLTKTTTPTLTPTITPTYTPSLSPTPTAFPTLSTNQAQTRLFELLAMNGGCRLPCLWGITVGKTTFQEARKILQPLSGISQSGSFGFPTSFENNTLDSIKPIFDEGDMETSADIRYLFAGDGIVNRIGFKGTQIKKIFRGNIVDGFQPIYDSKAFGERFHSYMLSELLSTLGKPTSVVMQTYRYGRGNNISNNGAFELILVYPNQGVLAHYTTEMRVIGRNAHACFPNAAVELNIFPSNDADNFVKSLAKQTYWDLFAQKETIDIDSPFWKSVEHATSMNLDQFYETFRQDSDHCIETPIDHWATPEP